jgi:3-hydroxyacyl-[acyl-carrier-protein] dehydratase
MAATEIRAIMDILPHRYPMLLIDRILELEHMVRAVGFKNVTANEPFFTGHFPGNPLFPGVLMIEAMAQLGGTMILEPGDWQRRIPYLAGIDKCKFRRPVIPGDRLMMEVKMLRHRKNIGWVEASSTVDGQHVCSAELMFSIVTDTGSFKLDSSVLHE